MLLPFADSLAAFCTRSTCVTPLSVLVVDPVMSERGRKRPVELSQETRYQDRGQRRRVTASQRAAGDSDERADVENLPPAGTSGPASRHAEPTFTWGVRRLRTPLGPAARQRTSAAPASLLRASGPAPAPRNPPSGTDPASSGRAPQRPESSGSAAGRHAPGIGQPHLQGRPIGMMSRSCSY